jgi:hypothetical protein
MTWRRVLNWGVFAVLVVCAILVRNHQIDKVELQEPIDVRGAEGQRLIGRNIAATLTGITITDSVIGDYGDDHPEIYAAHKGWVLAIFSVDAQSTVSDDKTNTDLVIAENTYGTRYMGIVPELQLTPGIPNQGYAGTFEIPVSALQSRASFRVTGSGNPSRDSRLVFDVTLANAQRVPSLTVKKRI